MSLQDTKNQIVNYIATIGSLDFSKLYIQSVSIVEWNQMSSEEVKLFVEDINVVLNNLKDNTIVLNSVSLNHLNDIRSNLEQIITYYNNNLANLVPNQITSQHHSVLNNFNNVSNILRSTGLYTQLKLAPEFDETVKKLKEANNQLKDFKPEEFEKASDLVNDLIQKKISFEDQTIKQHLGSFIHSADEHKIHRNEKFFSFKFSGQWWWLFSALAVSVLVGYIVFSFIKVLELNNGSISTGAAILRISSLIIPSYFMIFFINQFNYHKKMYEIYSFKNTALNTMTELMKINQSKSDYILEQGLNVLFNEPQIKEDGKYDKQLVNELIGIVKNQLGNK